MIQSLQRMFGLAKSQRVSSRRRSPAAARSGLREMSLECLEGRELLSRAPLVPVVAAHVAEVGSPHAMAGTKVIPDVSGTWDVHLTGSGVDLTGGVTIVQDGKLVTAQVNLGGQT